MIWHKTIGAQLLLSNCQKKKIDFFYICVNDSITDMKLKLVVTSFLTGVNWSVNSCEWTLWLKNKTGWKKTKEKTKAVWYDLVPKWWNKELTRALTQTVSNNTPAADSKQSSKAHNLVGNVWITGHETSVLCIYTYVDETCQASMQLHKKCWSS